MLVRASFWPEATSKKLMAADDSAAVVQQAPGSSVEQQSGVSGNEYMRVNGWDVMSGGKLWQGCVHVQ